MKYKARNEALQDLVKMLLPELLEELKRDEDEEKIEEKKVSEPITLQKELEAPRIVDKEVKPKGISLSITKLGLMGRGKPVMENVTKKQRKRPARRRK